MLASNSITFPLGTAQVHAIRKENGKMMREIKVLKNNQCKIVIIDALIQNITAEKNLNGGRAALLK